MQITSFPFPKNKERTAFIDAYRLENGILSVDVLTQGGIIQSLRYEGVDVVCGFDSMQEYLASGCYYGAIVGRCCNRMQSLRIGEERYNVSLNENGDTHLHGGFEGFDKKLWKASVTKDALELTYRSADGEEGYPGNLDVSIGYSLDGSALRLLFTAQSDRDTAVNLTNHSYFNLNGAGGNILQHTLCIPAKVISVCDEKHIPTGEYISVAGTPFDFTTPKPIGQDIGCAHPQLTPWGGFDNNYMLDKGTAFGRAARIVGEHVNGKTIAMEVLTDQPCAQLYTANDSHTPPMKGGTAQIRNRAFCIETQAEPNSFNFGEKTLAAGEFYRSETVFRFDTL